MHAIKGTLMTRAAGGHRHLLKATGGQHTGRRGGSSTLMAPHGGLQGLLGVLLLLAGRPACHATDAKPCLAAGPASYLLLFSGQWSSTTFPKQYPLFRPPAQWSKLIVITHGPPFRLWREGGHASPGVKRFAEDGQADELVKELTEIRKSLKMIHAIHQAPNVSSGTGRTAARVLVVPRASRISLLMKLIPSPDWFTGVDSLDLCDGGHWKPRVTLELRPYDAGTDSGFTFSSPNFPTSPQENITRITSQSPNHPASSFYYPRLAELPPLATLTIVRRTKRPTGRLHPSHHMRRVPGIQQFSETPLDCEVSRWSSWGLCSAPCAQAGLRQRTRFVLLRPANDGEPCPDLEEESPCVREGCSVDGDRR
ncbi:spondin-2a [Erpetoichthys calabaricus]|uniref:spondin-2a n=1 Tax=Erpetoichthys calabaricus TaxID=27687 RepID=UPI0022348F0A|nr:spondin-2a [Erpetoichthys calabaricus]